MSAVVENELRKIGEQLQEIVNVLTLFWEKQNIEVEKRKIIWRETEREVYRKWRDDNANITKTTAADETQDRKA